MQAIILVGGFGTRLRPLTLSKPKPLVEFCNMHMVEHQIKALAQVGVERVILAVSYRPQDMSDFVSMVRTRYQVDVVIAVEPEPLGTGGGVGFSKTLLANGKPFFCLNSDITCDFPFKSMIDFHTDRSARATMLVTRVNEPSKYGVVVTQANGRVEHFVEKPQTFVSNLINAGIYLFDSSVLDAIEAKPMSLEKDVFPLLAQEGRLYAIVNTGFWMDIGQPKDYLAGTRLFLNHMALEPQDARSNGDDAQEGRLADGHNIRGVCLVHPTASVSPDAVIGPDVVVGPNVTIGPGARIVSSVLLDNSTVEPHALVSHSIVGWRSTVHSWAHVANYSVLGENVQIGPACAVNGAIVLPHKSIDKSVWSNEIIM